jgi:hypothetical protein
MKFKFEANITLLLREQDVNLLLKAVRELSPETEGEAANRAYLIDILTYLATE